MPFLIPQDTFSAINFLGLTATPELQTAIDNRFGEIEAMAEDLVATIQNDLAELSTLDGQLQQYMGSIQYGVKRSNTTEFEKGEKVLGMLTRTIQLTRRLGTNLKQDPNLAPLQEMYGIISGDGLPQPITVPKVRG